jgi:hypothetical protein
VQDRKDFGFGDLLIRPQVHANDQAGVLAMAAQQQEEAKTLAVDLIRFSVAGGLFILSVKPTS